MPRSEHSISRKNISPNAIKVLYRLKDNGYQAHLVGGCVRDMLLGREPKDFDVATDAPPQDIKQSFRNARLIGRRFRLAHILFKGEIIEVSTFRGEHQGDPMENTHSKEGMIIRDNVYGTLEEDAKRRDFTVNALYYNIAAFSVLDFHNGLMDLQAGVLRLIGEPEQRYREDPVRILRAVRFAAKLGFRIDAKTEAGIFQMGHLLSVISPARLFNEVLKLFLGHCALITFKLLHHYKLFTYLFPATAKCLDSQEFATINQFINIVLQDTDDRLSQNKTVSPGYLFAALLWHPLQKRILELKADGVHPTYAFYIASHDVLQEQNRCAAIPRHFTMIVKTIWELQLRFEKRKRSKCIDIINHPRFRAAYDFLYLRARSGENVQQFYAWWKSFYDGDDIFRRQLLNKLGKRKLKQKPTRKKDS